MARQTLLELTQNILGALEDDEVNSISDTVSSYIVAQTIIDCFYELVDELSLPGKNRLLELEAVSDPSRPNYLKLPNNYQKLWWFKYNDKKLTYLSPWEFIEFLGKRDSGVTVVDFGGVEMKIVDTSDPTYWTSFDDTYLVLDSFNSSEDTTLQESKTTAYVEFGPELVLSDDAIPDIPDRLFPTLLSKAKARCFITMKQVSNTKEDQAERRGLIRHQNDMLRSNGVRPIDRLPNYAKAGRANRKGPSRRLSQM